jgi:uncharacterized protein (DUF1800 family)
LTNELQRLGEPLYRKIEPTGYSSANAEWTGAAGLLDRMNFGLALANNRVPGLRVIISEKDPLAVVRQILGEEPGAQTKSAIEKTVDPSLVAGLALGSPEFQRR